MTRRKKGQRARQPVLHHRRGPSADKPVVTEHAMLRYLERIYGLDIEAMRDEILAEGRAGVIFLIENGKVPIGEGHHLVVQGRRVLTVVPNR